MSYGRPGELHDLDGYQHESEMNCARATQHADGKGPMLKHTTTYPGPRYQSLQQSVGMRVCESKLPESATGMQTGTPFISMGGHIPQAKEVGDAGPWEDVTSGDKCQISF